MTLQDVKQYLRVTTDNEDAVIQANLTAAKTYIKAQTGKTKVKSGETEADIETDELWGMAVKLMVAHWYENRAIEVTGTIVARLSHTVDALVNHIAMCGDYT